MVEAIGVEFDGKRSICGYAAEEAKCTEFIVKESSALDFQFFILNSLAKNLKDVSEPKLNVFFFKIGENINRSVTLTPETINDIRRARDQRTYGMDIDISVNESDIFGGFGEMMLVVKIVMSAVESLASKHSFMYAAALQIPAFDTGKIVLQITKTV